MALGDLARRRQRPLDRRDVAVGAVGGEAEPERQPASAPGEVDGEIRWIAGLPVDLIQIARQLRVRGARGLGIAVEERAAVVGGEEPLVGVDDEAVGELDAVEEVADAGGGKRRSAVGAVDVEPDPALGAHRGDARQVVHEARVRRAGGGHDREDVVGSLCERCIESFAAEAAARVLLHLEDPDVEHPRCHSDRGMHVSGAGQPPSAGRPLAATGQSSMPRRGERREVPAGAAGDEAARGTRRASRAAR